MPKSLLFITSTRIGDAVISTGVLNYLVKANPGLKVTVACGPLCASLFATVPGLERLLLVEKKKWHAHWALLWARTVPLRWDMVVDLRSSPLSWFLWANQRIQLTSDKGRNQEHMVSRFSALVGQPPLSPRLRVDEGRRKWAESFLEKTGPLLVLQPFANAFHKVWPVHNFIELARRLTAQPGPLEGARIVLVGAAHERAYAQPIFEAFAANQCLDLFGQADLLKVQAVLEKADLCVGNDSGITHMAAASGQPVLGLFGPTPDWLYAPWGTRAMVVRSTGVSVPEPHARLPHPTLPENMADLGIEQVENAAKELLERCTDKTFDALKGQGKMA